MNWRPWLVAAALMAALILNTALLVTEDVRPPEKQQGPTVAITDRHMKMTYSANNRLPNFKAFGMDESMAEAANKKAIKLQQDRGKRWGQLLDENKAETVAVFCPTSTGVPARYAAMSMIVVEEEDGRRPIEPQELTEFKVQEWYTVAQVKDTYDAIELADDYQTDGTVMGIAALLLTEEDKVIEGESPWGTGLMTKWSFTSMLDQYQDKKIRQKLVDYFATMHLLTEMANGENGICE